ncbi:unnamed protein product [Oncorhynchus mykiss]|uniref:Elastin n=1 Tax=Oncorhynchus mykiss TaxID=8022 RepID=A0A060WJG0_ONCMY|nr:unnamed protein product [Oncorhynchus mykiss]
MSAGFGGRGVLPGVATGNGLNPKSLPGGGQQGPGGSGRVGYGGPMQPGVFHGYPLKTPKTQGMSPDNLMTANDIFSTINSQVKC